MPAWSERASVGAKLICHCILVTCQLLIAQLRLETEAIESAVHHYRQLAEDVAKIGRASTMSNNLLTLTPAYLCTRAHLVVVGMLLLQVPLSTCCYHGSSPW